MERHYLLRANFVNRMSDIGLYCFLTRDVTFTYVRFHLNGHGHCLNCYWFTEACHSFLYAVQLACAKSQERWLARQKKLSHRYPFTSDAASVIRGILRQIYYCPSIKQVFQCHSRRCLSSQPIFPTVRLSVGFQNVRCLMVQYYSYGVTKTDEHLSNRCVHAIDDDRCGCS